MGQSSSSENNHKTSINLQLSRAEVNELFQARCLQLLTPKTLSFVKSFSKQSSNDPAASTYLSSARVVEWNLNGFEVDSRARDELKAAVNILFRIMKYIGQFPFPKLSSKDDSEVISLTMQEFVIASVFISGRYRKLFGNDNGEIIWKFLFIALSHQSDMNFFDDDLDHLFTIPLKYPIEDEDSIAIKAQKVDWGGLEIIKKLSNLDMNQLQLQPSLFLNLTTLFLLTESIPNQKHNKMHDQFVHNLTTWKDFRKYSLDLLRYMNNDLSKDDLNRQTLSWSEFSLGMNNLLAPFVEVNLRKVVENNVLNISLPFFETSANSKMDGTGDEVPNGATTGTKTTMKENEGAGVEAQSKEETKVGNDVESSFGSKLVSISLIAYISSMLRGIGSTIEVTRFNAIKLFAGLEAGFSIRSLENKIYKWHAPTLLFVSGKRIKQRTIDTNRRYQEFDETYPKFFQANEDLLKSWQYTNDRITYCVLINQPWQNSNKKNFGDEKSLILSLEPRADYYTSLHSDILKGQLIYFNNSGMGLGFGNAQPLNKSNNKKYYPGDVSLTIESNLEFAVFRHLGSLSTNATTYFNRSRLSSTVAHEDFEDRFLITDLEVWGIGSKKELEEQQRQWKWEEQQAEARQSVNIRNMGEERAFLEMAGLVGNHGSGGSL